MDAPPAVNRPPLRNPSPILGSGSLSLLPVRDVPLPFRKAGAWFDSRRKHRCFPLSVAPDPRVRSALWTAPVVTSATPTASVTWQFVPRAVITKDFILTKEFNRIGV